jgi:alpha-glucosidase
MLGDDYTPAFFRDRIDGFFTGAPQGWPMWAFSNHDVRRHAGRWAAHGTSVEAVAKQAASLLLSFEGSVCLWQGEELGQTDTELSFAELTDPQGIAFWPAPVGRDGTRTPMVWDGGPQGGFTTGTPWLPVKAPQLARHAAGQIGRAGSVMEHYRAMIAFRKATPALVTGRTRFLDTPAPVLAFTRGDGLLCAFNLSPAPVTLAAQGLGAALGPSLGASLTGDRLTLAPSAAAFFATTGTPALTA